MDISSVCQQKSGMAHEEIRLQVIQELLFSVFLACVPSSTPLVLVSVFTPETQIPDPVEGHRGHPWQQLCVY